MRIEPPPSVPSASVVMPVAMAAPAPPEEPPGAKSRFHGLRVMPQSSLCVCGAWAISGVVVRACMIAPASSRRSTVGAENSGTWSAKMREPKVVISPLSAWKSLMTTGTPSSGRVSAPEA